MKTLDIRLIEAAFPLKQIPLDSIHEKNVRHGHISTLHIWPAQRPLAASRAALLATLLPDPGYRDERRHQALTRGRRRSEGASPVSDPHRPGRGAGDPFPREGALMAQPRYSGSGAGE